jgi:hypothetical protein
MSRRYNQDASILWTCERQRAKEQRVGTRPFNDPAVAFMVPTSLSCSESVVAHGIDFKLTGSLQITWQANWVALTTNPRPAASKPARLSREKLLMSAAITSKVPATSLMRLEERCLDVESVHPWAIVGGGGVYVKIGVLLKHGCGRSAEAQAMNTKTLNVRLGPRRKTRTRTSELLLKGPPPAASPATVPGVMSSIRGSILWFETPINSLMSHTDPHAPPHSGQNITETIYAEQLSTHSGIIYPEPNRNNADSEWKST